MGVIFICSYVAFALSVVCGGGAGLMLIPLLGGILPVSQIPAALSIGTFTSSASRLAIFYKNIQWKIVRWFVPAAIPAVWLGAWLLNYVEPAYLELVMGLFLVGNLPMVFQKKGSLKKDKHPLPNYLLLVIGAIAGFVSGITGAVGLLFNRFYLRYGLTKEEIVATRAANEILLHFIKIILYLLFGLIGTGASMAGIAVAIAAILASWSMKYILPKLSDVLFRKIGYTAMVVSGVLMLSKAGESLMVEHGLQVVWRSEEKGISGRILLNNGYDYALEYHFGEGFELEQTIPFSDLSRQSQEWVIEQGKSVEYDLLQIEAVYGIRKRYYEAYYMQHGELVKKITFSDIQ